MALFGIYFIGFIGIFIVALISIFKAITGGNATPSQDVDAVLRRHNQLHDMAVRSHAMMMHHM